MKSIQENLNFLLNKYSVDADVEFKDNKTIVVNGIKIPLLAHRCNRRLVELKNLVHNGTLVGVSVMRVARIVEKGLDIYDELYRELDICQYVLQRKISSIMVMQNGCVLNAIATTAEDNIVCTIEISATLKKGEPAKDKHEIISQRGIACDIVVDAQIKQDSIYVFGADNQKYTDVDFELFGLDADEVAAVRAAFQIAQERNYDELLDADKNLCQLVNAARDSAKKNERLVL